MCSRAASQPLHPKSGYKPLGRTRVQSTVSPAALWPWQRVRVYGMQFIDHREWERGGQSIPTQAAHLTTIDAKTAHDEDLLPLVGGDGPEVAGIIDPESSRDGHEKPPVRRQQTAHV